jgi:hypothetical protein
MPTLTIRDTDIHIHTKANTNKGSNNTTVFPVFKPRSVLAHNTFYITVPHSLGGKRLHLESGVTNEAISASPALLLEQAV